MRKVIYRGPQESYGFLWKDGEYKQFERGVESETTDDVAEYVLTALNPRKFPLGREAHDSGSEVFDEVVVDLKAGRKAAPVGGDL